jgi:hypothetical protein
MVETAVKQIGSEVVYRINGLANTGTFEIHKSGEFLDQLRDCQLLKEDPTTES